MATDGEEQESDEKITVLFPDAETEIEGKKTTAPSDPSDGHHEEQASEEAVDDKDNVVHLDFDRRPTAKSPRPKREIRPDESAKAKFEVFQLMIEEGMVMVSLDTGVEGVEVPPRFEGLPELHLNFSHMFHIDDFDYDLEGVRASLSFQGTRYFCDIPWASVSRLYSHNSGHVAVFESDD